MHCCNTVAMASAVIAASLLLLLSSAQPVSSNPVSSQSNYVPDYELLSLLELLSKLRQTSSITEDPAMKRGLDLGINRGFSGAQAAKHLMGLAAAQYAAGPGRRRRDVA